MKIKARFTGLVLKSKQQSEKSMRMKHLFKHHPLKGNLT